MSRARDTADQINRVNSSAADATAITVDSSENVGIGVTPETWDTSYRALQFAGNGALSGWGTQTNGAAVFLSQNAYKGSTWKYISGTDEASLYEKVNGAHTFYTASSGSADSTISWNTKLKIDSDGLKFNGDTAAANALDDYEEGSCTLTWIGSGGTNDTTASFNYIKIGAMVNVYGNTSATVPNATGGLHLDGLPFSSSSTNRSPGAVLYRHLTPPSGAHTLISYIGSNSNDIELYWSSSVNYTQFTSSNYNTVGGADFYINLIYTTAS